MLRRGLPVAPLVLFLLAVATSSACAAWPGWPHGMPAFRAPAALIDVTPGDLADHQPVLQVCSGDIDGHGPCDLAVLDRDSAAAGTDPKEVAFMMNHTDPGERKARSQ